MLADSTGGAAGAPRVRGVQACTTADSACIVHSDMKSNTSPVELRRSIVPDANTRKYAAPR